MQIKNSPRRSFARGFYVPDVKKLPKMLCLVVSWMSFLDGICAGKPRLDRLSHFLLRFASTHPVAVRNEVPVHRPNVQAEKSTTISVDPLFQDSKFSPSHTSPTSWSEELSVLSSVLANFFLYFSPAMETCLRKY